MAENVKAQIGWKIVAARVKSRMTALELASQAQVHRNTVYRIESGLCYSIESLYRITRVLGITLDSLFVDVKLEDAQIDLWPETRGQQLRLWPNPILPKPRALPKRRKVKPTDAKRLSGNSRGRSAQVLTMPSSVGCKRSRPA